MTLVSKSGILLNLSIYDNLTLENPQATKEEVDSICKLLGIYHTFQNLPDGLIDKKLFDCYLSEETLQLMLIGRALLNKEAKILLFDDVLVKLHP